MKKLPIGSYYFLSTGFKLVISGTGIYILLFYLLIKESHWIWLESVWFGEVLTTFRPFVFLQALDSAKSNPLTIWLLEFDDELDDEFELTADCTKLASFITLILIAENVAGIPTTGAGAILDTFETVEDEFGDIGGCCGCGNRNIGGIGKMLNEDELKDELLIVEDGTITAEVITVDWVDWDNTVDIRATTDIVLTRICLSVNCEDI